VKDSERIHRWLVESLYDMTVGKVNTTLAGMKDATTTTRRIWIFFR
jgi:hypothetical protein